MEAAVTMCYVEMFNFVSFHLHAGNMIIFLSDMRCNDFSTFVFLPFGDETGRIYPAQNKKSKEGEIFKLPERETWWHIMTAKMSA